jgi:hypothetical protein
MDPGLFFSVQISIRTQPRMAPGAGRRCSDRTAVNSPAEWRRWVILKNLSRVVPLTGGATDSQKLAAVAQSGRAQRRQR